MDTFDAMAKYAYSQSLENLTQKDCCVALVLFAAVFLTSALAGRHDPKWNGRKTVSLSVLLPYLYLVFMFAVFGREVRNPDPPWEWIPFWSYYEAFAHGRRILLFACFLNVLMFVPLGICLAGLDIPFRYAVLTGACISYFIEICQLLTRKGLFELFDDPFHNVLGTAAGFAVCIGAGRIVSVWKRKSTQRGKKDGSQKEIP